MAYLDDTNCCGIKEIDGLEGEHNPHYVLRGILRDWWNGGYHEGSGYGNCAFIFFSTTNHYTKGIGKTLTDYIHAHKLGRVTRSRPLVNPNSGNKVTMWMWELSKRNIAAWCRKEFATDY